MARRKLEFDPDAKRLYQQSVLQQSLEFDKQLVWLSGGAIALVAAFVTAVRPLMIGWSLVLAGIGVSLLLASLAITLASFQVSIVDSGQVLAGAQDFDRRQKRMRVLNAASLGAFVLGVAAFLVFAYVVLPRGGAAQAFSVPSAAGSSPAASQDASRSSEPVPALRSKR